MLQLPVYTNTGDGEPADATAAQSEVLALNDTQFLVLSRDGNGRGKGSANATVFKSVLLVDMAGATNLAGTSYDRGPNRWPRVAAGRRDHAGAAGRAGQHAEPGPAGPVRHEPQGRAVDRYTLSEKREAMALAPVLEEGAQRLLPARRQRQRLRDRQGRLCRDDFDASLNSAKARGLGTTNVVMVYRLTLPGYVPAGTRR